MCQGVPHWLPVELPLAPRGAPPAPCPHISMPPAQVGSLDKPDLALLGTDMASSMGCVSPPWFWGILTHPRETPSALCGMERGFSP